MSNLKRQPSVVNCQLSAVKHRRLKVICRSLKEAMRDKISPTKILPLVAALFVVAFAAGCRQDMQTQPRYEALRPSDFFRDGTSARPLVPGTIPRGYLRDDEALYTGKIAANARTPGAAPSSGGSGANQRQTESRAQQPTTQNAGGGAATGGSAAASGANASATSANKVYTEGEVTEFPFPVTQAVLNRGEERYKIFCSMCHGLTGAGDGMVVQRGYKKPPSYLEDRLKQAPVGHFFDVVTNGWGAMPSYAAQIPPRDRWAIIAYVRALQLSGGAPNANSGNKVASAKTNGMTAIGGGGQ